MSNKRSVYTPAPPPESNTTVSLSEGALVSASKTVVLNEALDLSEAVLDAENRVIRNAVLISAGMSKNRRYYSESVLQAAASVFENSKAYADHPSKSEMKDRPERSIRDLTGWYTNVRYQENKLVADRYFTRNQAGNDAWAIAEDIANKRAPASLAGLSINAVGKGVMKKFDDGDALEVELINSAMSVDDVSIPAAGGSYLLTASAGGDELIKGVLETLDYQEWLAARPEYLERLKREYKAVRLEDETKTRLAEADQKVKTAETHVSEIEAAFQEAQTTIQKLITTNDKLTADISQLRIEKSVLEALEGVQLPASFMDDLRQTLPTLPPVEWAAKIEIEKAKVKSAGVTPRIRVTQADMQENHQPHIPSPKVVVNPLPLENETVGEWRKRTGRK